MTGSERRAQLINVGRGLFAEKGLDGTTVEEIAAAAGVSKPVVYEHFGGKEGLYAVVVDREMRALLDLITSSLSAGNPRDLAEGAARAFLTYIDTRSDGFRILVRESPVGSQTGSFASLISDIASQVEHIFVREFSKRGFDPNIAPIYANMLVGMVAQTGVWWLEVRSPAIEEVATHLVNLAWNGLHNLENLPLHNRSLTKTEPVVESDETSA